jgi:hypothetical protein
MRDVKYLYIAASAVAEDALPNRRRELAEWAGSTTRIKAAFGSRISRNTKVLCRHPAQMDWVAHSSSACEGKTRQEPGNNKAAAEYEAADCCDTPTGL